LRVSSKGGAFVELEQFDLAKEKGFWRFQLLGYLGRGHNALLGSSGRYFGGALIYIESGTIFPRGGCNFGVDLLMRGVQASSFS
jgi:hypothetical protein